MKAAYYTLSAASMPLTDLPPEEAKRLPRYPTLPAVRIGRLAVDQRFQRRGLDELMPMNAVHRTMQDAAAAFTLLVDAKNEQAVAFYRRYGFRPLAGKPRTLFLPSRRPRKRFFQNALIVDAITAPATIPRRLPPATDVCHPPGS
jgi:predicted N-acetyltransferase YhbS